MFIHTGLKSLSFRLNLFYIFGNTKYLVFLWFHNAVRTMIVWWHLHICNLNFWGGSVHNYHLVEDKFVLLKNYFFVGKLSTITGFKATKPYKRQKEHNLNSSYFTNGHWLMKEFLKLAPCINKSRADCWIWM